MVPTTLRDLILRYAATVSPTKRGAAVEAVRLARLARDALSDMPITEIGGPALAAWRDRRLTEVAAATVRRELVLLGHLFEIARREWGVEVDNPVRVIRRPPDSRPRDRRLERRQQEAERLLAACRAARSAWLAPMVELALETAMRRGELLALDWADVDLERATAVLHQTKNGERRRVPLSRRARAVLAALGPRLNGFVFRGVSAEAVKHAFRRAVRRAGLRDFRFHDLRHEATSRLFEKGLTLMEVATITGHRDPRMLRRYTHFFVEELARKLDPA